MHYVKFPRVFVIVCDSLGIGAAPDAAAYGDSGTDTFGHAALACGHLSVPTLNSLGIADIDNALGTAVCPHPSGYCARLIEASAAKDTLTGHWEMMGIITREPFRTYTDSGFPEAMKREFEKEAGVKVLWNKAASGTEIIARLGEQERAEKSLIVYTSGDSVFQIAAHEDAIPVSELYDYCRIARRICDKPEYKVGRVIARPFVGTDKDSFRRVIADRRDFCHTPTGATVMSRLADMGYMTYCIGKTCDIFSMVGVKQGEHTENNHDGMLKTIKQAREGEWGGMCFTNLVEFDSEYGHRRNAVGYGKCLEAFDRDLYDLIQALHHDDLLIVTGDHGNDPLFRGTDHTREMVPFLAFSKSLGHGRRLSDRKTFADLGATIGANFGLANADGLAGSPIVETLVTDA